MVRSRIFSVLLLAGLLFSACTPKTQPIAATATASPTVVPRIITETPSFTATVPPTSMPSPTSVLVITETPIVTPSPEAAVTNIVSTNANSGPNIAFTGSIDEMKLTQDRACLPISGPVGNKDKETFDKTEQAAVDAQVEFAMVNEYSNTVAISPPLNDFTCDNGFEYNAYDTMMRWRNAVNTHNGFLWYRVQLTTFRNFYNAGIDTNLDHHIQAHVDFILAHPDLFKPGDIYTPNPEPSSATIEGVNCFKDQGQTCLFTGGSQQDNIAQFNAWLIKLQQAVEAAFTDAGVTGVRVGYYGFDGFIAGVDHNPDWHGMVDPETLKVLGNVMAIDHYLKNGTDVEAEVAYVVSTLREKYGEDVVICWSEYGPTEGQSLEDVEKFLHAVWANGIRCFNWWSTGPGRGNPGTNDWQSPESLLSYTPNTPWDLTVEYPTYAAPSVYDPQEGRVVMLVPSQYAPILRDWYRNPN